MRFGVELRASPPKHSKEVILRPGVLVVARDLNFSGDQKIRVVERSKSVCVCVGGGGGSRVSEVGKEGDEEVQEATQAVLMVVIRMFGM
jgi:hypothetical protein